jgi:hypothetical protein
MRQAGISPIVGVSEKAERFARSQALWLSLVRIKSLVLEADARGVVEAVDVDVVGDPEVGDKLLICFSIRVNAPIPETLDLDQRISGLMYEEVPREDQIHFAVRFDFA